MVENIAEDIVLEEYLSDDKLNIILDRVNGWIDNCDSKVSTILSSVGIIAGIFLATDYVKKIISIIQTAYKCDNVWARIYLMVSAISVILLIIGVCMLISTLFARVNSKAFKKKNVKTESILFFSSIAQNESFPKYLTKVRECSDAQLKEDLISQIYICSLICDKKFGLYKCGLLFSAIGFSLFVLMMSIGVAVF